MLKILINEKEQHKQSEAGWYVHNHEPVLKLESGEIFSSSKINPGQLDYYPFTIKEHYILESLGTPDVQALIANDSSFVKIPDNFKLFIHNDVVCIRIYDSVYNIETGLEVNCEFSGIYATTLDLTLSFVTK